MILYILFILIVLFFLFYLGREILQLYKIIQAQEHELELFYKENQVQNKTLKILEDRISDLENKFI